MTCSMSLLRIFGNSDIARKKIEIAEKSEFVEWNGIGGGLKSRWWIVEDCGWCGWWIVEDSILLNRGGLATPLNSLT